MSVDVTKPKQIDNLLEKVRDCIENEKFTQTNHALQRHQERFINLEHALYVLKHGYHEKRKTIFDNVYHTWKYAIRGTTFDNFNIRVIVAFDEEGMIIITVMHVVED